MSDYPPPPSPMGSIPPSPGDYAMQAPRTNVMAIVSLVCGLLLCIPFVTNILAIIFGAIGIAKSSQPGTGGKGMAIAGIILGLIGIGFWSLGGWGAWKVYQMTGPMRNLGTAFVSDLAAGNIDKAAAVTDTTVLSKDKLKEISSDMSSWGPVKKTTLTKFNLVNNQLQLGGTAEFTNTTRQFDLTLVQSGGTWKVTDVQFK